MITTPWLLRFGQVAEVHVRPQEAAASGLLSGKASVELWLKVLQAKPGYHRVEPKSLRCGTRKINGEEWSSRPVESHLHISHDSLQYIFSPTQLLLTVSAIIVLHYCYFFIKSRRYKINYSQTEWRLKAGLFTHGWTEDPQTYSFSRLLQAELHIFIRAEYFNLH